jgi:DNA-binding SARP family transcriptional activator
LHTTLHRLRKLLRHADAVVLKDGHLTLSDRLIWVDLRAIESLLARVERAVARPSPDPDALGAWQRRIRELCRGGFLELEPERQWAIRVADLLRQRLVRVSLALGRHWRAIEEIDRAIEACQMALDADDLSESAYHQLMRLHADQSNVAEALRTYERCRSALATGVHATPGPAMRELLLRLRTRQIVRPS